MASARGNLEERRTMYLKVLSVCCVLLTFMAVTVALFQLRAILVPFTLSVFLYFMLAPTVQFLEKELKFPRGLSMACAVVGSLLLISLLGLVLTLSLANLFDNADLYLSRLQLTIDSLAADLTGAGVRVDIAKLQREISNISVLDLVRQFTSGFLGLMGTFSLVMIFTAFLLIGKKAPNDESGLFAAVADRVSKYVSIKLLVSLCTGLSVGVTLAIIGIEFAMTFGVLAFLLNFIPNIGSIIATLLPLPIAFLEYGFGIQFFLTLMIPGTIQMYAGNVLEPRWMGESLGLHPVVVLFFLFFWGIVWGLPGMFLSVPIMATLKFIFSQSRSTQFLVDLLEGRVGKVLDRMPS